MKKIIIPFNGSHFSKGSFSFASTLNQMENILLCGIFLPEVEYARLFFFPTAFAAPMYLPMLEDFNDEDVQKNIEQFGDLCQKNGIEYRVHKDLYEASIPQLTKESRFADLMVLGSETFYKSGTNYGSNDYLKDALHKTECSVVILPEKYDFPTHIILAYDGSASSVFAIKQFAFLFPELSTLKTILVYAGDEKHEIPDLDLMEELAARHFGDLTISKITLIHKHDITDWFSKHKDSLVVSGSFGRSGFSQLFSKSFIMDIIKEYKTPVFIAHQ